MSIIQYHYTDSEIKKILTSMVILVDTREQENSHILDYLAKKKIPIKSRKLDYGDYSFMIPAAPELGILREISFMSEIVIERKSGLEELSGNLAQDRARFEAEFIRASGCQCRFLLMIENASYSDIINHNYRTEYNPKSFLASLMSMAHRYNFSVNFVDKQIAGSFIYHMFYYFLRNYLKG